MDPVKPKVALKVQLDYRPQAKLKTEQKGLLEKYTIDWEHTDEAFKSFWNQHLGATFGYTEDFRRAVAGELGQILAQKEKKIIYPPAKTLENRAVQYAKVLLDMPVEKMLKVGKDEIEKLAKEKVKAENLATYERVKEDLWGNESIYVLPENRAAIEVKIFNIINTSSTAFTEEAMHDLFKQSFSAIEQESGASSNSQ